MKELFFYQNSPPKRISSMLIYGTYLQKRTQKYFKLTLPLPPPLHPQHTHQHNNIFTVQFVFTGYYKPWLWQTNYPSPKHFVIAEFDCMFIVLVTFILIINYKHTEGDKSIENKIYWWKITLFVICMWSEKPRKTNFAFELSNGHSPQIHENGELLVWMCRGESHFSQKWPLANVGKSGKSSQHGLANVGESGESSNSLNLLASSHCLIWIWILQCFFSYTK